VNPLLALSERLARALAVAIVVASASGLATAPLGRAAPVAAATPVPIVLVHGYGGSPDSFAVMERRFRALGHTVVAIDLPGDNNVANAKAIRDLVAANGWQKVAIVGHSMGGLSSRAWIRSYGGRKVAVTYVSLGTPQQGIIVACALQRSNGGQMCPTDPFMTKLNSGDPTPGPTTWTSIFSTTDGLVPTSASRLAGGACNVRVSGPDHSGLLTDPKVFRLVRDAIDAKPCRGVIVP
jgi:triacylglycerol lipase